MGQEHVKAVDKGHKAFRKRMKLSMIGVCVGKI